MKFIPLVLTIASVSSAAEAINKCKNHNETTKSSYEESHTITERSEVYDKSVTITEHNPISSISTYKTISEYSKPSDIPTLIYTPSLSKSSYPEELTYSEDEPSKSLNSSVYSKPSESTHESVYPKSSVSVIKPSEPTHESVYPKSSKSASKPNTSTYNSAQSKPSESINKPAYPESNKPSSESEPKPSGSYPSDDLNEQTVEMLCRVNALRAEVGKKPYKIDQRLMTAAQKHSEDQAANKQMSHTGSKIKSFSQRIKAAGYKGIGSGENVAWNQANIAHVMDSWRKSSGHYKNIIGDFDCFGWGEKDRYYTQDFARGSECTNQVIPQCKSYPSFNPNDAWEKIKN